MYNKTKRQGGVDNQARLGVIVACLMLTGFIMFITDNHESRIKSLEQNDKCLQAMQEAIPDPNETEERSLLLKECYEN